MSKTTKAAGKLARVDRAVTNAAAAHRDAPAVKLLGAMSEVADQPPLILLGLGTIAAGAMLRRPAVMRSGVRILASELVATKLKSLVKHSVDRTRPEKAIATGKHRFERGRSHDHEETSFPSGHAAGAVAVAGAIAQDVPGALVPAYLVAGSVAAIQMPRGKHYVLDVVVGAAIGLVAQKATSAVLRVAEPALVDLMRRRQN